MTRNLANFLLDRASVRPDLRVGVVGDDITLEEAVNVGREVAGSLAAASVTPGSRIAVVGETSTEYLLFWIGCQLAGVEPALINPSYPDDLLEQMLGVLDPMAVATPSGKREFGDRPTLGFRQLRTGAVTLDERPLPGHDLTEFPGCHREELEVAGYMHTSGTTGLPKFCAQSHRYFLRLGRWVADELALGPADRVLAPLPMFHINPLGYGFLGALTGLADVLGLHRFSAGSFWPTVQEQGISVLILHAPPVEILRRRTSPAEAAGHRVRAQFYADAAFLQEFSIPVGLSGYGSTEAAGLTHLWHWRSGETTDIPEGMSHYGGRARDDVEFLVADDGEILLRGREPGVLFSGYLRDGRLDPSVDEDGWFHSGDLGRLDDRGQLVFIERAAESIRVKGEFVPIDHVERAFAGISDLEDLALWKRPGQLKDDEVVLFIVATHLPMTEIARCAEGLPPFMRPAYVARVSEIPRDAGAGKVRRRRLDPAAAIELLPC